MLRDVFSYKYELIFIKKKVFLEDRVKSLENWGKSWEENGIRDFFLGGRIGLWLIDILCL